MGVDTSHHKNEETNDSMRHTYTKKFPHIGKRPSDLQ